MKKAAKRYFDAEYRSWIKRKTDERHRGFQLIFVIYFLLALLATAGKEIVCH